MCLSYNRAHGRFSWQGVLPLKPILKSVLFAMIRPSFSISSSPFLLSQRSVPCAYYTCFSYPFLLALLPLLGHRGHSPVTPPGCSELLCLFTEHVLSHTRVECLSFLFFACLFFNLCPHGHAMVMGNAMTLSRRKMCTGLEAKKIVLMLYSTE